MLPVRQPGFFIAILMRDGAGKPSDLDALTALQRGLLESAAHLVDPGGTVVYSTCSVEPEENAGIIQPVFKQSSRICP